MAKNHIDNLSEEAEKGLRQKALEGMWPSFAPLGSEVKGDPSGGIGELAAGLAVWIIIELRECRRQNQWQSIACAPRVACAAE